MPKQITECTHTIHLSTNIGRQCEHCEEWTGADPEGATDLAESINHYINEHGYRLLHVGTETNRDGDEKELWYSTIAILGK